MLKDEAAKDKSIYDQNDYYQADGEASRLTPLLNGLIRWVDKSKARHIVSAYGKHGGRALDVGAGDGKFLHYLAQAGMLVSGTSASKISCDACLRLYGIRLEHTTSLPDVLLNEGRYDLISYWHVFEHLEDPLSHVQRWSQLLSDKGKLILEVPDQEALGARLHASCWLGSDPQHHINMCSMAELEQYVFEAGLKVQTRDRFSIKFSYVFLWSGLVARLFHRHWQFDQSFDLIKTPLKSLKRTPLRTINAWLSVFYLAPIILPLMLFELSQQRGEIIRLVCVRT